MNPNAAPVAASAKEMPTVGERVRLRKAHPCGGREWIVTREGADIGLECATCQRRVLWPFDEFLRRCAARALLAPTAARALPPVKPPVCGVPAVTSVCSVSNEATAPPA